MKRINERDWAFNLDTLQEINKIEMETIYSRNRIMMKTSPNVLRAW